MIGTINVPVKLVAKTAGNWIQIGGDEVNLRVALDQKSASFTPSTNGTYKFSRGEEIFEVQVGDVVTPPTTPPTTPPSPTGTLYDSNTDGKWNNGIARFVTDREGDTKANGKGFHVNASGGGGFRIDGKGQGNLEPASAGHRRIYVCACNYNAAIQGQFTFLTSDVRNFSIKGRNRHQYADEVDINAPDNKKQGGLGASISIEDQSVGFSIEVVHGTNTGSVDKPLSKKLEVGKLYGFRFSYKDKSSTEVDEKLEIDYGSGFETVLTNIAKPPSQFFNKADFDAWSEFWLRLNDSGKIGLKNIQLIQL